MLEFRAYFTFAGLWSNFVFKYRPVLIIILLLRQSRSATDWLVDRLCDRMCPVSFFWGLVISLRWPLIIKFVWIQCNHSFPWLYWRIIDARTFASLGTGGVSLLIIKVYFMHLLIPFISLQLFGCKAFLEEFLVAGWATLLASLLPTKTTTMLNSRHLQILMIQLIQLNFDINFLVFQ